MLSFSPRDVLGEILVLMSQFLRVFLPTRGGRVVRRCCVNFQCQGVLLIWIIVGQGPVALAVGAGGGVWTFFLSSIFSFFFLPLWETARYRLKYCLKGPLNPKQPTNQPILPNLTFNFTVSKNRIFVKLIYLVVD